MNSDTLKQKWANVCQRVVSYNDVDSLQFSALASRLQPQAISDGFLMLTTENAFLKSWAEKSFITAIQRALQDLYGMPFIVVVEIDEVKEEPAESISIETTQVSQLSQTQNINPIPNQSNINNIGEEPKPIRTTINTPKSSPIEPINVQNVSRETFLPVESNLNEDSVVDISSAKPDSVQHEQVLSSLTFENFVIGESNRMAYSMAVQVAEMPGNTALNPLFIYGKSGLGKTHLMRAIQNYINETQPHLHTIYVDSEELISGYTDAVAEHDREKSSYKNFKTYYEAADVLLVDDIQFLQGKKQTLDIVFQIFNKLTNQGKQIVLSADRAPKNIDIDERYSSRFVQGGTIDIQPPEVETKLAIVKSYINMYRKSEGNENLSIPEDVQFYIAENSGSNIRELKGALTIVIYHINFLQRDTISIGDVSQLLENHFSGGIRKNLTVEDIQKEVEQFYKVKHSDLIGPARDRGVTYPRQIAIYLCRQLLDLPFNDIGKKFNRDHTTIMHSVSKVEKMIITNRDVQEELEALKQMIKEL
ncbi:chromosomal replication initiator protein DnaA [Adlercreutzia sp. ZJ154]|uniref:chromosomal replication initiator protein DnaA n=1 Tax=Adlercreutzia sp. ZJ154 TaxID=2709790 RepID=UPI0013EC75AF|nr:chromosomal replication initiator protein DnaA [Adlercreutzia sp. ZJ154]